MVTDHGAFVLFNVYGPAITNADTADERFAFKLRFFEVSGPARLHASCVAYRPSCSQAHHFLVGCSS